MAGGIREVSGGIPTLERRSPLLWLEQDDSPQLPALNLKGIFLGRAFLVPVSRLCFLDCRSSTRVPPAEAADERMKLSSCSAQMLLARHQTLQAMNLLSWVGRRVTSGAQEQAGEFEVFILQARGV